MSKFSFTAPDGQVFDILGPANATIEQARAIFDQQFKSGGLVGLKVGETVSAVTQAEAGLRSALSQLGLKLPSATELAFGSLKNVPLLNPITAVDFIKQATPNFSLGSLKSSDIQGLMSQTAAQLDQSLNTVSASTGIGKFGLDINKLENAGYLKPGTASSYALSAVQAGTQKLESFLSPGAFTGKDGISNLQGILSNENVQNTIQGTVLKQSYNLLTSTGITQNLSTTQLGGLLQTASTFDVKTAVDFAKGFEVKNVSEVLSVAKAGEYATSLVNNYGSGIQTQVVNLGSLANQITNVGSIGDLAKLSGSLSGNLGGLAGEIGKLGGLAGTIGGLGSLAGLAGLGGLAGTIGKLGGTIGSAAGIAGTIGSVASQLGGLGAIASQINNATSFGSLASGIGSGIGVVTGVVGLVSGLFGGRGGSIYAGVRRPQGVSNTVNRDTVNASVTAIIGNEKISTPSFSPQSSDVLAGLQTLKSLSGLANIAEKLRA
jgi:hypothetical protein